MGASPRPSPVYLVILRSGPNRSAKSSASARSRCAPRGSPRPNTSRRCRTRAPPPPCAWRSPRRRCLEELAVHRLCARLVYRHAVFRELLEDALRRATVEEREVYDLARGLLPRRNLLGRGDVK